MDGSFNDNCQYQEFFQESRVHWYNRHDLFNSIPMKKKCRGWWQKFCVMPPIKRFLRALSGPGFSNSFPGVRRTNRLTSALNRSILMGWRENPVSEWRGPSSLHPGLHCGYERSCKKANGRSGYPQENKRSECWKETISGDWCKKSRETQRTETFSEIRRIIKNIEYLQNRNGTIRNIVSNSEVHQGKKQSKETIEKRVSKIKGKIRSLHIKKNCLFPRKGIITCRMGKKSEILFSVL